MNKSKTIKIVVFLVILAVIAAGIISCVNAVFEPTSKEEEKRLLDAADRRDELEFERQKQMIDDLIGD